MFVDVDSSHFGSEQTLTALPLLTKIGAKMVAESFGHSTIVLTLDTYSHVLPTMQRDASNELERMLFAGAS